MTIKEWRELASKFPAGVGLKMEWAIFDREKNEGIEDYDEWHLDFTAPNLPDGLYACVYGYGNPTKGECVLIQDGKFESFMTAAFLYDLVWPTESHSKGMVPCKRGDSVGHRYIERLEWIAEEGHFRLHTAS